MSKLKKVFAGSLILGLLVPALAFAETSASTSASALVSQIQARQIQINSLRQQQQQGIATLMTTLKQGSSGDQVAVLQALLAADPNIYPQGTISGFFGKLTTQAVKRFQKQNGLDQVGNVGPKTLQKLQELLNEHPLAFGMMASTTAPSVASRDRRGEKRPCAIIPPGHLIAPGWLKKHEGEDKPIVPTCQILPKGIKALFGEGRGTTTPPVVDVTIPTISGTSVSPIASTTVTIRWTTNENATGKVYYATTSPVNLSTAFTTGTASLSMNHSFGLTGLTPSTVYFYVLESKDSSNNSATTSSQSFATTN